MAKNNIDDYKNRMTSPIGAVRIDPKTGKPIKPAKRSTTTNKKKGK